MAHDGHVIAQFIRRLSPAGLKAVGGLCDVLDKLELVPVDPRVAAALAAVRAACEVRKRFRKER